MKKNYSFLRTACLSALLAVGSQTFAQGVEGVDLEVYYMNYITASAQQQQSPSFYLHNNGSVAVQTFSVEVSLNDELAFTEDVTLDKPLAPDDAKTVYLEGKVTLPFGQTSTVSLKVIADGDVDESNNTASRSVTMPEVVPFPYIWSLDDCRTVFTAESDFFFGFGGGWEWNNEQEGFYLFGKGTNWMFAITSKIFDLPEGENVTVSFDYAIQSSGKMKITLGTPEGNEELTTALTGDGTFHTAFVSFEAKGPSTLAFLPTLDNAFDYAGIYVRNINVKKAVRDLATTQILEPATTQIAVSPQPVTVTARFVNVSPFDIENPEFVYDAGDGQEVRETYNGIIAGGAQLDYTFSQTYVRTEPGEATLAVWCEVSRDGNSDNDRVEKQISYYAAMAFPYQTGFDADTDKWATIGGSNWSFSWLTDGNAVAVGQGGYLFSPAVSMPAGTARVSFYYASMQRAGANLKLYMGRGTSESELTEVLFDKNIENGGWLNGYHLINIEEAGNYYFAFKLDNTQDAIIIDNFKVDAEEDLCIGDITFDQQSGFNLTSAKVTISFINHGVSPQSNIALRYYVNSLDGDYVEETYTGVVEPGETVFYTFEQPVDISELGQAYTLFGQIATVVGSDLQNDLIQGQTIENFAPYTAPYYYNFADATQNSQWTLPQNNGSQWTIENNFYSYDGSNVLTATHSQWSFDEPADDWAYSPAIVLQPGKYEVSFMHRGRTYFDGVDYEQNFEAKMGTSRSPEAMTIELSRHENLDYKGMMNYMKDVAFVEITEAGEYFLGFHNFSPANDGELRIDAVEVKAVADGLALPFETTFADGDEGWTKYNENNATGYFPRWTVEDGAMQALMDWGYVEGMLVSPKLALEAGKVVTVTVDYELESSEADLALNLFDATLNSPQAMTLQATGEQSDNSVSYVFSTGTEARDFYLGLHTSLDLNEKEYLYTSYTLKINRVSVTAVDDETVGIASVAAQSGKTVVYDLQGRRVAAPAKGLFIENGRKVVK